MANLGTNDTGIGWIAARIVKQAGSLKVCVDSTKDVKEAEALTANIGQLTLNLNILLGRVEVEQGI